MVRRVLALALFFLLLTAGGADAGSAKVSMVDSSGLAQGVAAVKLAKGAVKLKVALAPLPAMVNTGNEQFEATIYKAYLTNSMDPAVEISLGSVYPNTKSKAKLKVAFKGDVSRLGLDRVVVVAFSKDGLSSFDVLTGTITGQ